MLHVGGSPADGIDGPGIDRLGRADVMVVASDFSAIRPGIDNFWVAGIRSDVAAFTTADVVPIWAINRTLGTRAGDSDRGVILLRAVNVVGEAIIGGDVIELRGWLVVDGAPALASVDGNCRAAVVAIDEALGIGGINPQGVIIAVGRANGSEGLATIVGAINA